MSADNALRPEHFTIAGDIPTLVWRGAGSGPRPVLIYMHGGGHTKWDVDPIALELIPPQGVTLLSFDLWMHGDRIPPSGKPAERTADRFLMSLEQCSADLFSILDYVRGDPSMDADHLGLHGYSHSSTVALVALGMNLPVHACLSVAGAGDLAALFAYMAHQGDMPSAQIDEELTKEHDRFMRLNPLHHVDSFPPCAIMMIHGLHDVIAPFSAHFALYQALLPYYRSRSGDCLFVAHADGHWPAETVKRVAFSWLAERLTSAL